MKKPDIYLSDIGGYRSNLQILRFFAAIMVIFAHSFSIAEGNSDNEWFGVITNNQYSMGGFAVLIFFFLSGYLVTNSIVKNDGKNFFLMRLSKLFPLLFIVVILSAFIMGPFATTYGLGDYFLDKQTYMYLLNAVFVPHTNILPVHDLPGVFFGNAFLPTVNGSLWTLPIELFLYVVCFALYKIKFLEKRKIVFTLPLVVIGLIVTEFTANSFLVSLSMPSLIFYLGMLFSIFKDKVKLRYLWSLPCIIVIVVSALLGYGYIGLALGLPYLVLLLGYKMKPFLVNLSQFGNLSYGIYLTGFVIQQLITFLFGGQMNPYLNAALAIPICILLGYVGHRFVEDSIENHVRKRIKR